MKPDQNGKLPDFSFYFASPGEDDPIEEGCDFSISFHGTPKHRTWTIGEDGLTHPERRISELEQALRSVYGSLNLFSGKWPSADTLMSECPSEAAKLHRDCCKAEDRVDELEVLLKVSKKDMPTLAYADEDGLDLEWHEDNTVTILRYGNEEVEFIVFEDGKVVKRFQYERSEA